MMIFKKYNSLPDILSESDKSPKTARSPVVPYCVSFLDPHHADAETVFLTVWRVEGGFINFHKKLPEKNPEVLN